MPWPRSNTFQIPLRQAAQAAFVDVAEGFSLTAAQGERQRALSQPDRLAPEAAGYAAQSLPSQAGTLFEKYWV
jgi:hypothetical protein